MSSLALVCAAARAHSDVSGPDSVACPALDTADATTVQRAVSSHRPGRQMSTFLRAVSASHIARALGGQKTGGAWVARCPADDYRTPSLSIREKGGKVLFTVTRAASRPT